jgi:Branched-chain amino acid ATP-binding cassette transporter
MIGNHKRLNQGLWFNLIQRRDFRREFDANVEAARALVTIFEPQLANRLFEPVAGLPMIDRRRIEICRALISAPRLLLLDEPSAGLGPDEVEHLTTLLSGLPAATAVVLVDHHLPLVWAVADTVTVLHHGQHLRTGTPAAVQADPRVRDAYLAPPTTRNTGTGPRQARTRGPGTAAGTRPARRVPRSGRPAPPRPEPAPRHRARPAGPQRRRQDHPAQHHRRPAPAARRPRPARRT